MESGPETGRRRVTLAVVAELAGVSTSTASLAFSGSSRVAEPTRARVLAAAQSLGYAGPDPTASALRRGRSGVVGVVLADRLRYAFRDPVAVQTLDGLTDALSPLGVGLLLLADGETGSAADADRASRLALDAAVLLTCGREDDPTLVALQARGVPVVSVEGPRGQGLVSVDLDARPGAVAAAEHLADLGHRRVASVAMPVRREGAGGPLTRSRLQGPGFRGARERLLALREVFPEAPAVEAATNSVEEGERAAALLLDVGADRPTAVVAQSDILAAGVLQAAERRGIRVPADLSVVGFDGADLPWLAPRVLTTVVQPTAEKGRAAGRAVAALLRGERPADVLLPVTLRIGTTTGPAPSAR